MSASTLEREQACPTSVHLLQVLTSGDDAERGTCLHAFRAAVANGMSRKTALALVPERWKPDAEALDTEKVLAGCTDVRTEVAFAVNVETGAVRELGAHINRDYRITDDEEAGTSDIIATNFMGVPLVIDWKEGFQEATPIPFNLQLQFGSYCRAYLTGSNEVEACIPYRWGAQSHTFTRIDLDGFIDTLREIRAGKLAAGEHLAMGRPPVVSAGSWCKYCPALPCCPSQTGLARQMLPELERIESTIATMMPAQAGVAWDKLAAIKVLHDHAKEGLKALARRVNLPLADGREVRPITFPKEYFVQARAIEVMRRLGATEEDIQAAFVTKQETHVKALKAR